MCLCVSHEFCSYALYVSLLIMEFRFASISFNPTSPTVFDEFLFSHFVPAAQMLSYFQFPLSTSGSDLNIFYEIRK